MHAAQDGRTDFIRILAQCGSDVNATDNVHIHVLVDVQYTSICLSNSFDVHFLLRFVLYLDVFREIFKIEFFGVVFDGILLYADW